MRRAFYPSAHERPHIAIRLLYPGKNFSARFTWSSLSHPTSSADQFLVRLVVALRLRALRSVVISVHQN